MNPLPSNPSTAVLPEWLTARQTAEIFQVNLRTIRRWINDGRLPVRRHGRTVRIHRTALDRPQP